jgi:uncharacterized protein YjiS (DUF1127 family)
MSKTIIPAATLRSGAVFGNDLGVLGSLAQVSSQVFGTLLVWQMRARQRVRLAEMESHRLEDMGIMPAEAKREAAKPFWRP